MHVNKSNNAIKKPKFIMGLVDPRSANILRILRSEFRPEHTEVLVEKIIMKEKLL